MRDIEPELVVSRPAEAETALGVCDVGGEIQIVLGVAVPDASLSHISGESASIVLSTASGPLAAQDDDAPVLSTATILTDAQTAARQQVSQVTAQLHAAAEARAATALQSVVRRRAARHHAERRRSAEQAAREAEERVAALQHVLAEREVELLGERERVESERRRQGDVARQLEREARAREAAEAAAHEAQERVAAMEAETIALHAALAAHKEQLSQMSAFNAEAQKQQQQQQRRRRQRHQMVVAYRRWQKVAEGLQSSVFMQGIQIILRSLKRTRAAQRLQRFVRRRRLRAQWLELIEDLLGYNNLMRQLK